MNIFLHVCVHISITRAIKHDHAYDHSDVDDQDTVASKVENLLVGPRFGLWSGVRRVFLNTLVTDSRFTGDEMEMWCG